MTSTDQTAPLPSAPSASFISAVPVPVAVAQHSAPPIIATAQVVQVNQQQNDDDDGGAYYRGRYDNDTEMPTATVAAIVPATTGGAYNQPTQINTDEPPVQKFILKAKAGRNGSQEGRAAWGAAGANNNGGNGKNAEPPLPGENAGDVDLSISMENTSNNGKICVKGALKENSNPYPLVTTYFVPVTTDFHVEAKGGAGGHGGHGGTGGNRGKGRHGRNATRYSSGGNGGPGGQGGNAGAGTNGAPGGAGGHINIRVNDNESYYLMAFCCLDNNDAIQKAVPGGDPGKIGKHGSPGQGGSGGKGGSSYHWTDSDGKGHTRTFGLSGRAGRPGISVSHQLYPGMIGAKGKVTICVDDSQQFTKRFDLQLSSLSIETSQRLHETDRVFQFTDSVQIRDMTCVNVGGMVSPIQGSNVCFRKRSEWVGLNHIVPDMEGMGWFAERLAPEEIGAIQGDLSFSIQPPNIRELEHDMEPYRVKEKLYLACTQNGGFGFHRPYSNFHTNGTWLEFRFPVESLEKIQGLSTICPGDGTHVKLSVTNNSLRDLGAKTKDGRKLVVQFYRNTKKDVAHSHIDLIVDGKKCDLKLANTGNLWRGTQFEIPCLGAGQTKTFAGTLKLSSQVSPYSRLAIQAEILLEELKGVNVESPKMIPIQRRQLKVSSEPIYTPSPYNQVVLVTCATTTKEQFNAWSELLINRLGLSVEYFSVSICGSLDPSFTPPNVMGEGTKSITLAQAFAEKLVIVLDSVFNPLDESVSRTEPSRMLPNGSQSQTSGYNKSTRWLLVGSSDDAVKQALASHFTAPPDDVTNYTDFSSFNKAMKEELKRERDEGCVTDERICEYSIRVNNGKENNRFNKGKSIGKKAKECVKHLKKNDPLRQYVVEPRMTIKDDAETAYRLLVVRRGYCRTANTTYVLKEAVSPKEADGNALLAIVKSLPLDTLQLVFAKAVSDEDEVLLDVAMDVYTQHLIWGVSSVLDGQLECNNVEEEDLSKIFPTLASVTLCSKMHTVATSHGDRGKRALSQLLARLECVARSKDLNPGPFPFSLRNRTRKVLLKMVATLKEEWADIIFDDARLEEIHALEKKVKDHLKSTYGGPFPRQRSASRWRKGLLYLTSYRNKDKYKGDGFCGPTIRLCEMESLEYKNKSRAIAPSKTILTEQDCNSMRKHADGQKELASKLLKSITDTRERLGLGGEGEVEVDLS